MPSKTSQHIAFFVVLFISMGLHLYVFQNLKRVLRRDYPKIGQRLVRIFLLLFILMDTPFLFLWLQGSFHKTMTLLTHLILYPFLVWQTILLMWALILIPITIVRRTKMAGRYLLRNKNSNRMMETELAMEAAAE